MQRALVSLALAVLLVPTAAGEDDEVKRSIERFELFNACRPMRLLVEGLGDDAEAIGLTEAALQAAAERRLRAARLYTEDRERANLAKLYVNVLVVGKAFSLSVDYEKRVTDGFGKSGTATTWTSGSAGTASSGGFIVSGLSGHLDRFLAAYLRVNESACGSAESFISPWIDRLWDRIP